jgi:hypothetical protein
VRSWQSRLQAKMNTLSQKLVDNTITLSGAATDCIFIRQNLNKMSDPVSLTIDDVDVINIVFPPLIDIPLRRFLWSTGHFIQANDAVEEENQPFECYAEVKYRVDQGSIILKFFDNPQGTTPSGESYSTTEPWVLPLKVADVMGTFGGRSMVWQKLNLVYYDNMLPDQIYQWCIQLAARRELLKW